MCIDQASSAKHHLRRKLTRKSRRRASNHMGIVQARQRKAEVGNRDLWPDGRRTLQDRAIHLDILEDSGKLVAMAPTSARPNKPVRAYEALSKRFVHRRRREELQALSA